MVAPKQVPLIAALILLAGGGFFLVEKAERQARDTTRKHHLQDIEASLYFARSLEGTYPPYTESSWCGFLNAETNRTVRDQIEAALRAQNEKYTIIDKPFPTDPLASQDLSREASAKWDYFYWKRSPSMFELYAVMEEEKSGERNSLLCANAPAQYFDYGIASIQRERAGITVIDTPL